MPDAEGHDYGAMTLEDIQAHFTSFVTTGGRAGASGILHLADEQIDLRPTGGQAIAMTLFGLACLGVGVACYRLYPTVQATRFIAFGIFLSILVGGLYLITSMRLDVFDHKENRVIRSLAKRALCSLVEAGRCGSEPLEPDRFEVLKRLCKGDRTFRKRVEPILNLGPDPAEVLDFDTLESNMERASASGSDGDR